MVRPLKIGLISNPKSNANKKHGGLGARIKPEPGILVARPTTHDELKDELLRFAKEGVEVVAIDGGDGTVRDVISFIHYGYPDVWPSFALLPGGKTNVIAAHVGGFGKGLEGWQSLLKAREAGTLSKVQEECAALEVSFPAEPDFLMRGFLLGAAAFTDGVAMANESLHPKGIAQSLAVALAIGGMLRRAVFRRSQDDNRISKAGTVSLDGVALPVQYHFLVMASTLERLTMGIKPFRNEGVGDVFWLDVSASAKWFLIGGAMVAMGAHKEWMRNAGYASGRTHEMDIVSDAPFVLDGETYDPKGHIKVSASQRLRFFGT